MSRFIMTTFGAGLTLLVASCGSSDGGPGPGGGSGGTMGDGAVASDAAEGPFECLPGNIARSKSDGDQEPCGMERCTVQDGCGIPGALGCETDDDCVSSTLEAGWQVDYPVKCIAGGCGAVTPPPGH